MHDEGPDAYPAHEREVADAMRNNDIVDSIVEDRDRTCCISVWLSNANKGRLPVTPTMTSGCAANIEKTTAPRTDASSTSLTP
jgi:hypothetical protein